jgi:UDP-2,3-diacylglucosamine hydrolase
MTQANSPVQQLVAPGHWRTVDFISDLHLQASEEPTFQAWQRYLQETPADAVFMLGDLFEAWVGDDARLAAIAPGEAPFEARCAQALGSAAAHSALFFLHGNRDFLVGADFLQVSQVQLLPDPTVLAFAGQRWLLTHGDALCLADTHYLTFREQVRNPDWQKAFLAQPLVQRQAIAAGMRQQSEAHQQVNPNQFDVDLEAARAWLAAAQASVLIHGHTHRPDTHDLGNGLQRWVLSDWDCSAQPPRAEVLRLQLAVPTAGAATLQRIALPCA